jgi:hypothetical protein
MRDSAMLELLPTPLAVVCHDAGATNIIYSWIESSVQASPGFANAIRIYSLGPAKNLINNYDLDAIEYCTSLEDAMKNAQTLLAGTGWATPLELQALTLARQAGIRSIAVIDHWINYTERFFIDGWKVDPEEIWVTDAYAKEIAQRSFSGARIEQHSNLYLTRTVARVHASSQPKHSSLRVLYVLEPIRTTWVEGREPGEFDALDYFFECVGDLFSQPVEEIRLRPHPSEPPGKYDRWLAPMASPRVSLDDHPDVESSVAWADIVVGCQTMAMVVALQAGKRVISSMPPWAPPCALPHEGIEKMANRL